MGTSEAFFDRVARRSRKSGAPGATATRTVAATKPHLSGEERVLDFGCGTGSLSLMVAEHVAFVHGVDTSAGMIKVARAEANRRGVLNVDFSKSDIFSEEFTGADFNVVVAFNVLHYAGDVEAVCARLAELLVPEGLFMSSTACLSERRSLLGTTALLASRLRLVPEMKSLSLAELEGAITHGGFSLVESQKLSRLPDCFVAARKSPSLT